MTIIGIALLVEHEARTTFREDRPARRPSPSRPSLARRLAARLRHVPATAPAAA